MSDLTPMRRKIGAQRAGDAPPPLCPQRVWRRAVTHGLTRGAGLAVRIDAVTEARLQPEAAPVLAGEGALVALLDGPGGYGLAILTAPLVASIIEMQTLGRVLKRAPVPRAVTATDAAMVADPLDHVLKAHDALVAEVPQLGLAAGYRFATHITDLREIVLTLADSAHDHTALTMALGPDAAREGQLHLVLPRAMEAATSAGADTSWSSRIEARLLGSEVVVRAELARLSLPVHAVQGLATGEMLTLPRSALGAVRIVSATGAVLAEGRLGQSAGRKAVRLGPPAEAPFTLATLAAPRAEPAG